MDFDISTLLYILFAVIYFIFSKGKKKPKKQSRPSSRSSQPQPAAPASEPQRRPTFEELLEEFTGLKTVEEKAKPEPVLAPAVVPETRPLPRRESKAVVNEGRSSHRSMDSDFERFEEFEEEAPQHAFIDDLRNPDTARKAFIYSEIFKRKY